MDNAEVTQHVKRLGELFNESAQHTPVTDHHLVESLMCYAVDALALVKLSFHLG